MVSTLTTRAVTGGVVVSVIVAALYFLWKKKESNENEGNECNVEREQAQDRNNSGNNDTGSGEGGGGGDSGQPNQSESIQSSAYSSMTHSFEMINKEDVNNGHGQSDVKTKQERHAMSDMKDNSKTNGDGMVQEIPVTKVLHNVGKKMGNETKSHLQQKTASIENGEGMFETRTFHISEKKQGQKEEGNQKDGQKEKSGLSELLESIQASTAAALHTTQLDSNILNQNKSGKNQTKSHTSEKADSGPNDFFQIDRTENILPQDSETREQITKSGTKVSSFEQSPRVQTNGSDCSPHAEEKHVQQEMPYEKFSQDERTVAILVSQNSPGVVSSQNAEVLVSLLSHPDPQLKMAALIGINKCSSFTRNQNLLREHGCLHKLSDLLKQEAMSLESANRKFVSNLALAVNNLSANEQNQKELKDCVPALVDIALEDETGESVCLSSLQALTNLSVTSEHHGHYTRIIQKLYDYVEKAEPGIKLQAAKVLVNLSCNPDLVPHMLAAKAPSCLLDLLRTGTDEGILLRWTTLLANILSTVKEHNLSSASLPPDDKAPSPETMFSALYGSNSTTQIKSKVFLLCRHRNESIKHQATRIYHIYQTLNAK